MQTDAFLHHSGPAICPSNLGGRGKKGRGGKSCFIVSTADGARGGVFICQTLILVQHILLPPVTLQIDIIRRPKKTMLLLKCNHSKMREDGN